MRLFAILSKVEDQDDGTLKVFGVASSGSRDEAGEIITPDAMKAAIPDYMTFGAVREMHQPKAAGTALECSVDADGMTQFGAHVVDPVAISKVKAGVYKGFSVGGKVLARDPNDRTTITKIKLSEISLVDRPCNNDATLNLWKADIADPEGDPMSNAQPTNDDVKARAAELAKAAGRPDRPQDFLLKAREELVAKAAEAPGAALEPAPEAVEPAPEPVVKVDPAEALTAALAKATAAIEPAKVDPVTPGLSDLGKGLAKLGEVYGEGGLKKGFYGVSYLAEAISALCSVQSMAASDALYSPTGGDKQAPQMLAEAAQAAGQAMLQYVKETLADAMAQMQAVGAELDVVVVDGDEAFALAAAALDLVKSDAELMEKAGKRNSAKDAAAIQASHDHMVGLGAKCDKDNAEKGAAAADLEKLSAERDRFAETLEKALPAVEDLKKRVDDQAEEIRLLKAQPMPAKAAGSSLATVDKAADAAGAASPPGAPSVDDIQKTLDAMTPDERTDLLMRAAMARPIPIRV